MVALFNTAGRSSVGGFVLRWTGYKIEAGLDEFSLALLLGNILKAKHR